MARNSKKRSYDTEWNYNWRRTHPAEYAVQVRKRKYRKTGLKDDQIDTLIFKGCAVCQSEFVKSPHIDHDHRICSGKNHVCPKCFRGLLCSMCNTGFIRAIENRPSLRNHVSEYVLNYLDKLR